MSIQKRQLLYLIGRGEDWELYDFLSLTDKKLFGLRREKISTDLIFEFFEQIPDEAVWHECHPVLGDFRNLKEMRDYFAEPDKICILCGKGFCSTHEKRIMCTNCRGGRHFRERRHIDALEVCQSGIKNCSCCKEDKLVTEFVCANNMLDGFSSHCSPCKREKWQEHISKPGAREENRRRKREYGATPGGQEKRRAYRQLPHVKEKKRADDKLRDHIKRSPFDSGEKFYDVEIYEQENWTCQICLKKVNGNLKFPHPDSASLDHIVTFHDGGKHETSNVQTSHLRCNMQKSRKSFGQLKLF